MWSVYNIASVVSVIVVLLQVRHYERLSPLVPLENGLSGQYDRVRPGDCVVTFSRASVFQVRKKIEQATKQQCAVIYGGLPPGKIRDALYSPMLIELAIFME